MESSAMKFTTLSLFHLCKVYDCNVYANQLLFSILNLLLPINNKISTDTHLLMPLAILFIFEFAFLKGSSYHFLHDDGL